MAPGTWFMTGPAALHAAAALRRAPDLVVPNPAEDWRLARIDVVVHANRDQATIVHCLASLLRQTSPPRRVLLVDDGGAERDHGSQLAREFARANGLELRVIQRKWSIGKAATLKRQAREFTGDVMLVIDADTVLQSPRYIEQCIYRLYEGAGIASACGLLEPLRPADRKRQSGWPAFRNWLAGDDFVDPLSGGDFLQKGWQAWGDLCGAHVARLQQGLLERGAMVRHGGIPVPSGGAIAWRRRYLKDLFDRYEPVRGDNLTAMEDHFIGLALATEGYRNIRLRHVRARVQCPGPERLPVAAWREAIAQLQGAHYFDALLRTPFRNLRNRWRDWWAARRGQLPERHRWEEQRKVREAYRQPFGEWLTHHSGRPIGTTLLLLAFERIAWPTLLVVLAILGQWWALAAVVAVETGMTLAATAWVAPQRPWRAVLDGLLSTPLRYLALMTSLPAMLWFGLRLWSRRDFQWHAQRAAEGPPRPAARRRGKRR